MNNDRADATLKQHEGNDPLWLAPALLEFREKHYTSWVQLRRVGNLGANASFLALLRVGRIHQQYLLDGQSRNMANYLNHDNLDLKLQRSGDKRDELVFPAYQAAGKMVGKFIKHGLPESLTFGGVGTPESHASKCKEDASNVMNSRFNQVEPYLSKYAKYYVRKQMNTKKGNVYKDEKMKATEWLLEQRHDAGDLHVGAVVADPNGDPGAMASPKDRSPNRQDTPTNQFLTPRNMGVNKPYVIPSPGKRTRVDAEKEAPPFQLPSNHSTSPNVLIDNEVYGNDHVQCEHVESDSNPIPIIASLQVPSAQLIERAMNKVQIECPTEMLWLNGRTAGGIIMNPTQQAMDACDTGIRMELTEHRECIQHRRVVKSLQKWVVHLDDECESVYRFAEIEAVAAERVGGKNTIGTLLSMAEFLADQTVTTKKMMMETRKSVVSRFMSADDVKNLEDDIRTASKQLPNEERYLAKCEVSRGLLQRLPYDERDVVQNEIISGLMQKVELCNQENMDPCNVYLV